MEHTEATPEDLPPGILRKLIGMDEAGGTDTQKANSTIRGTSLRPLTPPPAPLLAETKEDRQDHVPNPLKHER